MRTAAPLAFWRCAGLLCLRWGPRLLARLQTRPDATCFYNPARLDELAKTAARTVRDARPSRRRLRTLVALRTWHLASQLGRLCFVGLQIPQRFLMGPGPANADPRVLNAQSLPLLGHM